MVANFSERFLVYYSGVLTLICCALILCGFASARKKNQFDEITVHRINVVEPDGTPRMILSSEDARPGSFFKGKEHPRPDRKGAGVNFYNNEGTEAGGLIYGSLVDKNGKIAEANVHLSFDQYNQDQVFAVDAGQESSGKFSMIRMNDVEDAPLIERMDASERIARLPKSEQEAAWTDFNSKHTPMKTRVVLGRVEDKSSVLQLKDVEGRSRLVLKVAPNGEPSIQMLDEQEHVQKEWGLSSARK